MLDFDANKGRILDRVDLVAVVSEHVSLKRSGRRFVGLCPFHSEKTPSFTVNPDLGIFKCFGCGKGGDVFSFVQFRENVSFIEAFRMLADRSGVELESGTRTDPSEPSRADLARANDWAVRFFRSTLLSESTGRRARDYVRDRGFSEETAERFSLGLAVDDASLREAAKQAGIPPTLLVAADLVRQSEEGRQYETFRNRLMFPIRDATKRVIGFGGRTLVNDKAKYLNTRQNALFEKGRAVYGIDAARASIEDRRRAVVVEGYTDCIAAHQAGFTETVATLGTALTPAHVDMLRRYGDEIILLFDSDAAGEAAADRAIGVALPRCVKVRLARIPEGKDPSDYLSHAGHDAFSDVLKQSIDALEFKWLQTRQRFEGGGADSARRDAVVDFVGVLSDACEAGAVDAIQRGLMINQAARLLRVDGDEIRQLMAKRPTRRRAGTDDAEESGGVSTPRAVADQAAWVRLLEVWLVDPSLVAAAEPLPDFAGITDACDRRIASLVCALASRSEGFRLADVLAGCRTPEETHRVASLAERGAVRGNLEETMRAALERLAQGEKARALDGTRLLLLHNEDGSAGSTEHADRLAVFQDGLMARRHFAPRRQIRGTMSPTPTKAVGDQGAGRDDVMES